MGVALLHVVSRAVSRGGGGAVGAPGTTSAHPAQECRGGGLRTYPRLQHRAREGGASWDRSTSGDTPPWSRSGGGRGRGLGRGEAARLVKGLCCILPGRLSTHAVSRACGHASHGAAPQAAHPTVWERILSSIGWCVTSSSPPVKGASGRGEGSRWALGIQSRHWRWAGLSFFTHAEQEGA